MGADRIVSTKPWNGERKTMNKHTPGPWTFENDEEDLDQWLIRAPSTDNNDTVGAVFKTGDSEYDNEVVYFNAHLIAAAPELLEALKAALDDSGCDGDLCANGWHEVARSAIAKAEWRDA